MSCDVPLVCIVGAPRSGTTWLQAMLGAHPVIATTQELKLFDLFTGPWQESWQQLVDLQRSAGGGPRGLRLVWSDDEFQARLRSVVGDVYGRVLARKPGATIVLDKSPGYSRYVGHIRRLVPHVKFIHCLRDGRDVATSLRAASTGWARTWAPDNIASAAFLWRSTIAAVRQEAAHDADRFFEVRYEELHGDGPATLARAFAFAGVSVTATAASDIYARHDFTAMRGGGSPFDLPPAFFRQGQVGGWRRELSATERYLFHDVSGDLLCELGYAQPGWWSERPFQRWLVPVFAAAGIRRRLRGMMDRGAIRPVLTRRP